MIVEDEITHEEIHILPGELLVFRLPDYMMNDSNVREYVERFIDQTRMGINTFVIVLPYGHDIKKYPQNMTLREFAEKQQMMGE